MSCGKFVIYNHFRKLFIQENVTMVDELCCWLTLKSSMQIESDEDVLWKADIRETKEELAARGLQFLNWWIFCLLDFRFFYSDFFRMPCWYKKMWAQGNVCVPLAYLKVYLNEGHSRIKLLQWNVVSYLFTTSHRYMMWFSVVLNLKMISVFSYKILTHLEAGLNSF